MLPRKKHNAYQSRRLSPELSDTSTRTSSTAANSASSPTHRGHRSASSETEPADLIGMHPLTASTRTGSRSSTENQRRHSASSLVLLYLISLRLSAYELSTRRRTGQCAASPSSRRQGIWYSAVTPAYCPAELLKLAIVHDIEQLAQGIFSTITMSTMTTADAGLGFVLFSLPYQ
ncbi:unnamed protein product [Jaminaea pallidilutea]